MINGIQPEFLITGPGRSGTKYIARVLKECGLDVGHESWWTIANKTQPMPNLDGDVSWIGAFDNAYTGRVLGQFRNPVDNIESIYNVGPAWTKYHMVRRLTVPDMTGNWLVDPIIIWNAYVDQTLARAEQWWQLEHVDADLIDAVFDIGVKRAQKAIDVIPKSANKRPNNNLLPYKWPHHPAADGMLERADALGYRIEDPRG